MKIYTKTGDAGQTSLVGGARVSKTHGRLDAYGTIDELNSYLGVCIASLHQESSSVSELKSLADQLSLLQHRLFNIGSLLACEDPKISANLPALEDKDIKNMETLIDRSTAQLAPLKEFILPGGSLSAAHLHVARTLARRAERQIVKLAETSSLHPLIVPYVNRLSDLLFVLARLTNHLLGNADIKWQKEP